MTTYPENLELPLAPDNSTDYLADELGRLAGKRVLITLTQNRVSLIHFRHEPGHVRLRLHQALVDMPQDVLESLAEWIRKPRRSGAPKLVRHYIRTVHIPEPDQARQRTRIQPQGEVHNLETLAKSVNETWFDGQITADVTWGRDTSSKRVRVRRLGSYQRSSNTIVIHPVLDDIRVPEMVVSFTLFHEMLHALQPASQKRHHDKAFRQKEQAHPDYEIVERWMKKNVRLINGGHRRKTS